MNLTTAFLFLFITILIPGFIFQRIYFFGDFSKQFTTKENVSKLLLTSLIPGLMISSLYLPCYNYFSWDDVKIDDILALFEKLSKSKVHEDEESLRVFGNYGSFLGYCFGESAIAGGLGFLFSRALVRGLKLDRRWKTLRYKNQWYYVFSGEVFEFDKFKRATETLSKIGRKGKEVQLARADVLIKGAEGSELYTGYVADYDLNPTDISKLDNLYLLDAIRYKTTELTEGLPNVKQPVVIEKKLIPGELFVLNMANVVNINVSYLLAPVKKVTKIKGQINTWLSATIKLISFILLLPGAMFIFYNPEWMDWFGFSEIEWYLKIPVFAAYMIFIWLILPIYSEKHKIHFYSRKHLILAFTVLLGLIAYYWLVCEYFYGVV